MKTGLAIQYTPQVRLQNGKPTMLACPVILIGEDYSATYSCIADQLWSSGVHFDSTMTPLEMLKHFSTPIDGFVIRLAELDTTENIVIEEVIDESKRSDKRTKRDKPKLV